MRGVLGAITLRRNDGSGTLVFDLDKVFGAGGDDFFVQVLRGFWNLISNTPPPTPIMPSYYQVTTIRPLL